MEAIDAIISRRSIRKYTSAPVPGDIVDKLLKAAMNAPSASNEQPWCFVVIDDRRILDDIPKFHPHSAMLKEAPLAIVVCGDMLLRKGEAWWVQDCSAATENLLLSAHAQGLGAVWLGVYPSEERVEGFKKLLELPEHIIPLSVVSIGYPAEFKSPANRFDPSRVHHNQW